MKIEEKILDPYIIRVDSYNHTLIKKGVGKDGKKTEDVIGYFSSITGALKKIVKLNIATEDKSHTIEEYIRRIISVQKGIALQLEEADTSRFIIEKIIYKIKPKTRKS